jgi:nucleolar protein 58
MVATKAALSIRLDALADVDAKSEPSAPTIGMQNRAKLESRLRALEYRSDLNGVRNGAGADPSLRKKHSKLELNNNAQTYNTAADSVNLIPTGRNPVEAAINAVAEVKEEKKKSKEERRKAKEEKKKGKAPAVDVDMEPVSVFFL